MTADSRLRSLTRQARALAERYPLRPGEASTLPDVGECAHGVHGQWHRWTWRPDRGEEESESEPEILRAPADCHECNCDDPHCARCLA